MRYAAYEEVKKQRERRKGGPRIYGRMPPQPEENPLWRQKIENEYKNARVGPRPPSPRQDPMRKFTTAQEAARNKKRATAKRRLRGYEDHATYDAAQPQNPSSGTALSVGHSGIRKRSTNRGKFANLAATARDEERKKDRSTRQALITLSTLAAITAAGSAYDSSLVDKKVIGMTGQINNQIGLVNERIITPLSEAVDTF